MLGIVAKPRIKPYQVRIVKKHDPIPQMVDANHVLVQQVIQAGYSEESSIEAVRTTRAKDVASAVQYLQDLEEADDNGILPHIVPPFSGQDASKSYSKRNRCFTC